LERKDKLSIDDIVLLTPGQQIKNIILKEYNSLDEFAEELGLYPVSLKQYLRSKKVGSSTFKIKVTQALGMGYDEIVKTEGEQIASYVNFVSDNIIKYNTKEDFKVLEKLRNMCIEYELTKEFGMMFRNFGRYYLGKNEVDKTIENMKIAINYLRNNNSKDYLIKYMSELASFYVTAGKQHEAEKLILQTEEILELTNDIDNPVISAINYNLGCCYIRINKTKLGIKRFQRSLNYASNRRQKGMTTVALGLAYKFDKQYDLALKHYNEALTVLDEDDSFIYTLYNNYASLYFEMKEYQKACYYIEKIFKELKGNTLFIMNKFFNNFAKIKMAMGQENEILDKLNELIEVENLEYIFVNHFIDSIKYIIDLSANNNMFLEKLKIILMNIIKRGKIENREIIEELKKHIGEIIILQHQNGI